MIISVLLDEEQQMLPEGFFRKQILIACKELQEVGKSKQFAGIWASYKTLWYEEATSTISS